MTTGVQRASEHPRTRQHMDLQPHQRFHTGRGPSCGPHNATTPHSPSDWNGRKNDGSPKGPKVRKHGAAVFGLRGGGGGGVALARGRYLRDDQKRRSPPRQMPPALSKERFGQRPELVIANTALSRRRRRFKTLCAFESARPFVARPHAQAFVIFGAMTSGFEIMFVILVGGGGGAGTRPRYPIVCLWRRPIGLSPPLILTLCGSERVLVVSTEPPDDLSCLTTPGVGRPGDGAVARAVDQGHPDAHPQSMRGSA